MNETPAPARLGPLGWLALAGVIVFGVDAWRRGSEVAPDPNVIAVDETFVATLGGEAALDRFVREEALVREARALGLDEDDPIVRRQLVRRMEAIRGERATREPMPRLHEEAVAMEHVFFSRSRRGEACESDARDALARLRAGELVAGDPFVAGARFDAITTSRLERTFGAGFAERALPALRSRGWEGPIPSAYGQHLVRGAERVSDTTQE